MNRITLLSALTIAVATSTAFAQDGGITVWPKGVPPGGITQKADFGNYLMQIAHRDATGRSELHKTKADVIVIQSGSATLLTGGEVIDPVPSGENEIQGTGIEGGVHREIGVGDVIQIPAGVPHQFFLKPGTQITYLIVKVKSERSVSGN